MKLVNLTAKIVHTKWTGFIKPGHSAEGNRDSKRFEEVMQEIVSSCGSKVGIMLSDNEVALLKTIMDLDQKGVKFDPSSIPNEVRNDPTGEKRASERSRAAQQAAIDGDRKRNIESARREAFINGEIDDRKPKGLSTMKGEPVDNSSLKSGFERIMEENARIEGEKGKVAKADANEILDPIGSHAKTSGEAGGDAAPADAAPAEAEADPAEAEPVDSAKEEGTGERTKSADAKEPIPTVSEKAGEMDRKAADTARKLAQFGPVDPKKQEKPAKAGKPEKPEKPSRATGRGRAAK